MAIGLSYTQEEIAAKKDDRPAQTGDDPSQPDGAWMAQCSGWEAMDAATEGTRFYRQNADVYFPALEGEDLTCLALRRSFITFTPYTQRLIDAGVGLILRKPIVLEGGNEAYWEQWRENCDREGSDLDAFARSVLTTAIGYGHSSILADYPKADGVRSRADERAMMLAPYLCQYKPKQVLGRRHDPQVMGGALQQVRLQEYASLPRGRYGVEARSQVRVIEPGSYEVWQAPDVKNDPEAGGYELVDSGTFSVDYVPLSTVYSKKISMLHSMPPLLDVAYLNTEHCKLQSQLMHALHISNYPLLLLKGYDNLSPDLKLNVTKVITLGIEGDGKYLEPGGASTKGAQEELEMLAQQMSNLGISILAEQKRVAESGVSKQLDRADTNSMLAVISRSLENALQQAINTCGSYAGMEPPTISIDRDFDAVAMEPEEIKSLVLLHDSDIVDTELAIQILQTGEVLPEDLDTDELMARLDEQKQERMDMVPPISQQLPQEQDNERDSSRQSGS